MLLDAGIGPFSLLTNYSLVLILKSFIYYYTNLKRLIALRSIFKSFLGKLDLSDSESTICDRVQY